MNKKIKIILYIVVIAVIVFVSSYAIVLKMVFNGDSSLLKRIILNNGFSQHALHAYHSLRKLPDIFFAPYYFVDSDLPEYRLFISPKDIALLNSSLPEEPLTGQLRNENRRWVDAFFVSKDYQADVEVRYRGTNANHWNSLQKSYRLNFPKDNLFNGMRAVNLVIPYDRKYFAEPLNFYRARKMGLTVPDMSFARLNLNGQDAGVYLVFEQWKDEFLERSPLSDNTAVLGADDGRNPNNNILGHLQFSIDIEGKPVYLNHYAGLIPEGSLETFALVLESANDEMFQKLIGNIFDLKKFYAWSVMNILMGSYHYANDLGNLILLFNPDTGRFEISPLDSGINENLAMDFNYADADARMKLAWRIFSFSEFLDERNALLEEYLQNEDNLADDLAFYDGLFSQTKGAFYGDSAKLYNNFQFLSQIKSLRKSVINNFYQARNVLGYDLSYYSKNGGQQLMEPILALGFGSSFDRFLETGYSIDEFISANPSFVKYDDSTIALFSGSYAFFSDVIIPPNFKVIFEPGTTVYLGDGVSIISYSPVIADASSGVPIRVLRALPQQSWGTFAVINTEEKKSIIDNVEFKGGSGDIINGITFTGMVSFHNANIDVINSVFKNAEDDDALNIKYGKALINDSLFSENFSDAVDVDFGSSETIISNNKFYNNGYGGGGDAIDLSWSNILITDNLIKGCTDKGISVGERSEPNIIKNTIEDCDIGIAVKDLSVAEISNNTIRGVRLGISAYQKKEVFGGGVANVTGTLIEDAEIDYETDSVSEINLR